MTSRGGNKSIYKIIFVTLFLDLVGFSIIFPIFPQIAKFYLEADGDGKLLRGIFYLIESWSGLGPENEMLNSMVLFGGVVGSVYSIMQFVFAPIWGSWSDKIGRRPILLITTFGTVISYGLWFFSDSFTLFFIARLLSGVMGGNVSTATTVIADITDENSRSKGMAFVGIAFALGFICGPALGGVLSTIELGEGLWGLPIKHPFALIALLGMVLSSINFVFLLFLFPETYVLRTKVKMNIVRRWLPFLSKVSHIRIRYINLSYFFYLLLFSGMEFTLTFLSFERFNYSPLQNAYLFIFSGVVMVLVQGGVVRRYANSIGERRLVWIGLIMVTFGLLVIALSDWVIMLYIGLLLLSAGAALVMPCLTALLSLSCDRNMQGVSIGLFRSYGAMARVLGPLFTTILYWNFGSQFTYMLGALLMIIPLYIFKRVK